MEAHPRMRHRRKSLTPLLLFAIGLTPACETGSRAAGPSEDSATVQMEIVSGSAQSAPAGSELPSPLVVRALDGAGKVKSGQIVNFVVVSGGGHLFAGTAITNRNGVAQDYWTLGSTVGRQVVEARAVDARTGERLVFATFDADATGATAPVLTQSTLSFPSLGDTARLAISGAAAAPQRAGAPSGPTWQSTDPNVVTVDGSGLVTSAGNGDALVVVTQNQLSDTASVHVRQDVASILVTPSSATLVAGDTLQLSAEAQDHNGYTVPGATIGWSSTDPAVATVSGTGTLAAMDAGTDTVYASSGATQGAATVLVNTPPVVGQATVSLGAGASFDALGDTATLDVTASDASGNPLSRAQLTWVSGNTSVATVDGNGRVQSVGNGSTFVFASYGSVADSAAVNVAQRVASVNVSPASLSLTVGQSGTLSATARDALGSPVAGAGIAWSSIDPSVATVDGSGHVTAVAAGATNVRATSGGVFGSAQVGVTAPTPPQVSVSPSSLSFTSLQDTARVVATAKDGNGNVLSASQLTWSSSDVGVATVTSTGLVRAVANGSARVVVSYQGVADTTLVNVAQTIASVSVSPGSVSLATGETQALAASARDAGGSTMAGALFTWTSANPSVATVTSAGLVTAVAGGSTTITATSGGVGGSASVSVTASGGSGLTSSWPNEPAGAALINDQPWNALSSNGWSHLNRGSESRIVSDATAPLSPNNVLEDIYPVGFTAGSEPAVDWIDLRGADPIYAGFYWKPSSPWQGHSSGINKILFAYNTQHGGNLVFVMRGSPGGPYYIEVIAQAHPAQSLGYLTQNVKKIPVELGKWHLIEFQSSLPGGWLKWYYDGELVGSYTGLVLDGTGFGEFSLAPTWGGIGGSKSETDYYRFDHVRISKIGSGGGGGGVTQAAVASVTVSPASASLTAGSSTTLQATLRDASGNILTGRTVTWASSATGVATVSGSGTVQGVAAGNATITATSEGISGTASVTVTTATTTNPGTVTDLRVVGSTSNSLTLQWTQVDDGTGAPAKYALRYGSPSVDWGGASATEVLVAGDGIGTSRTYTWSGLQPSTAYEFQAAAYRGTPNLDAVWGGLSNVASGQTTSDVPATSQQLVSEGFEDGNLGGRGWFDAASVSVVADARPGSSGTSALQWHWGTGTTAPQGSSRIDFTPSSSVYMRYWVKFSSNWVGSGRAYHPHLFQMLTTADDHYTGPSISHLTVYDEMLYLNGNLTAQLAIQDALMIDEANLNVDLRGVTEQRSIGGYNGQHEFDDATSTVRWDMYLYTAGQHTNYRLIRPKAVTISDATKNQWHLVETYWQMNSVSNGIGQQDGVLQYWVDGNLMVDRHDVYFRTGANPTMQFRTLLLAPYIGDGSPVDQYIRIDDLQLATGRP